MKHMKHTQVKQQFLYGRLGRVLTVAAIVALTASEALAEDPALPAEETARREAEAQLDQAQARLEQAAREIAEITARIVGDAGVTLVSRIEDFAARPRLGVTIGPVGGAGAREEGVKVLGVTPGSPADQAGIRSGDVLLALGTVALDWSGDTSPSEKVVRTLRELEQGTTIDVAYRRDGRDASVAVEARPWSWPHAFAFERDGMRPRGPMPPGAPGFLRRFVAESWGDMELVTLTPGLGEYFHADGGVLVVRAPADETLGLLDGDVILDIGGRKPADPGHVVRILRSYAPGERLVMSVLRKGEVRQLQADIPG
jgi:membrane-associated protease RseP (regulator of RpoE activity)